MIEIIRVLSELYFIRHHSLWLSDLEFVHMCRNQSSVLSFNIYSHMDAFCYSCRVKEFCWIDVLLLAMFKTLQPRVYSRNKTLDIFHSALLYELTCALSTLILCDNGVCCEIKSLCGGYLGLACRK